MTEGQIFNCAFGDRLRRQAAAGDVDALRTLASAAPVNMPKRAALAYRDAMLRRFADDLFAALPGASRHLVAGILAQAGHDLARKRGLTSRTPFDRLQDDERQRLQAGVLDLLDIARWPRLRQLEEIIGLQFSTVATANRSGVGLDSTGDELCNSAVPNPPKQTRSRRQRS